MEQIVRQIVQLLEEGFELLFSFLRLVWTWSFGQIVSILQSNWQALPIWKIVVLAVAIVAIAYLIYQVARQLWSALEAVFKSFVSLLTAFISALPYIVIAGLVAFAGSWIIRSVNF